MEDECFGTGEAELLEEVDLWGWSGEGMAVELLCGGLGRGPGSICKLARIMSKDQKVTKWNHPGLAGECNCTCLPSKKKF